MKIACPLFAQAAILLTWLVPPSVSAAESVPTTPRAQPPFWAEKGVFVYRLTAPDSPDTLTYAGEGIHLVANLTDRTVPQILIMNGLVGHDHPGNFNWDGLWPFWNRVTFRAGDWKALSAFMTAAREKSNASISFHVNLTDVNIGLRDYPETRDFFQKLVETQSIYRRDINKETNARDGVPYVPTEIDRYITKKEDDGTVDAVPIFALVNYQKFWTSGLAKQMIDEFYSHLPYAPPLLYLDVLTTKGGNFSTGAPDGPLGGSEETQVQGIQSIVDYLRSKGSDTATEGSRKFLGKNAEGLPRAGYNWYHAKGFSEDDYSVISGGSMKLFLQHVNGNPGAFHVSPIASTAAGMQAVRDHYASLLSGKTGPKKLPGLETFLLSVRPREMKVDEFDSPGANGDVFRGDWVDLVNYFYLVVIQENFHIGNRSIRERFGTPGLVHIGTYTVTPEAGGEPLAVAVPDFVTNYTKASAQKVGSMMLENPIETQVTAPKAGKYRFSTTYRIPGNVNANSPAQFNLYVNGQRAHLFTGLKKPATSGGFSEAGDLTIELKEGVNTIAFDPGVFSAKWSDGTQAEWTTPYLGTGFRAWKGDVVFADNYDRMWPDTWSGQRKIYFFSWDGTSRTWKLPEGWQDQKKLTLYPLTPEGRGKAETLDVSNGSVSPKLLPQIPYVLTE